FTPAVELLLFRIFQEGLTNVVKHAAASRVDVRLTREPEAVLLEIEDDGRGFDAHAYFRTPSPSTGLGLVSMRERVAHFGGVLGVAAMFVLLGADFLGVVQLLVYVGGILVLTLFAVMLTHRISDVNVSNRAVGRLPAAVLVSIAFAWMVHVARRATWVVKDPGAPAPTT